jgi:hypothetical protein
MPAAHLCSRLSLNRRNLFNPNQIIFPWQICWFLVNTTLRSSPFEHSLEAISRTLLVKFNLLLSVKLFPPFSIVLVLIVLEGHFTCSHPEALYTIARLEVSFFASHDGSIGLLSLCFLVELLVTHLEGVFTWLRLVALRWTVRLGIYRL